ncbi:MAG: cytochrome P450 [Deltaproteobacteria bacterium]|nr:cytochrome P450 [Deltaproteobacteria bacterium]
MSPAADRSIDSLPDGTDLLSPEAYAKGGYPWTRWDRLRRETPISRLRLAGQPYWAITRHADITTIGRNPELFLNGPKLVIRDTSGDDASFASRPKSLIEMDNPQHRAHRRLISNRFTPRALKAIHGDIDRIAREIVEKLLARGDDATIEFVEHVSAPLPIAVIAWLLGVDESDWNLIFDWTNRIIGGDDPEYQPVGKTRQEDGLSAMTELFTYFAQLVEQRRKNPKDDLISLFTQAKIDGKPLDMMEILAWCQIIVVAGNETTRNATSGGLLAFIEHPEQLRRLQADPSLMRPAIEEVVRWTSPIIHFGRTAAQDTIVSGVEIKRGDELALFYPSGNRDEAVFADPYTFRIDRNPNPHVGFGVGEHFCAGAHLARLELEMAFKYLLPRIEEIELAGPIDRLHSNLVGGIKRLPIRYKLKAA